MSSSVVDLERRAVLGTGLSVIVDASGRDIGVSQPLLDFGDVSLIIERIGRGSSPKGMGAYLKAQLR
jgi:hypothetical protein